jgi:hypothetical protein
MKQLLLFFISLCPITSFSKVIWFDGQHPITYQIPKKVEPVVKIALDMWMGDMQQVTGMRPQASASGMIKVTHNASLPHDGFRIQVNGGRILVEGGNGRGMAYGLLELSRLAGVSPWVWWGDVVPEKKKQLTINDDYTTEQSPSVEYRGIFLNDEDWSLRHWSYTTFEKRRAGEHSSGMPAPFGQIGPQTYKKIFQLLLRLRANAIWPGMHTGTIAFFKTPGAKAMADSCGIVIGTSHCEPLLRNNVDEWNVAERGAFNYRTNREQVQQYWIERLKEVKKSKDNMFTIGMRGIHDSSMEGYKTEQEKFDGLQQVINDQQELLRKYIGDPSKQMQVFVPYKEVLQLYKKGLQVPDYVTLMWCDDNYGYMTRLSNAKEQQRQGGGGVYYHLSYWGRPHDYLWLTTTQPGLIYNEMREAYNHNVRKLWIVNVHDVKVAGYDLELFLDMAWNINCVNGSTINNHYKAWLCREFGSNVGERLFPVMHEFYQLCGIRRPEFMGWNQVEVDKKLYDRGLSQVRNSDWSQAKCDWFEARFQALSSEVEEIGKSLRPSLSDAYFAAIKYPVQAAAAQVEKMLEAQRARKFATGSTRNDMFDGSESLRQAVARSHAAYNRIHELTAYYNNEMAGGKWKNLMCAHPRDLPVFWAPLVPIANTSQQPIGKTPSLLSTTNPDKGVINAYNYQSASDGTHIIQMLGHSMNAVAMPKDGHLAYDIEIDAEGDYTLQSALIPTQPNDDGDLRFSVSIDNGQPVVYSLKEPFRSERWKQNVLSGQAVRDTKVHLQQGRHTITLRALDHHIVFDQLRIFKSF